jgi:hypothetical protein
MCSNCYETHVIENKKLECPTCKKGLIKECYPPNKLKKSEIVKLDVNKILQRNIYIHQHFVLNRDYKVITLKSENNSIDVYGIKGIPMKYDGMLIGVNGFLYSYDEKTDLYYLAYKKQRFQFWDTSRIYRL